MIFYQLFEKESSTYTYILGDSLSKEAVIIDPVMENLERDLKLLNDLDLKLLFILDTHVHADHVTSSRFLRSKTGAQIGIGKAYGVSFADLSLSQNDVLSFGNHQIEVLHTPGHTEGCVSYLCESRVFTGDALLIRGCGRTDFQEGSSESLFDSIKNKLYVLPEETEVYPAHDYKGLSHSTIGLEKKLNSRINDSTTLEEFKRTMENLHLPRPKKIDEALPCNLSGGMKIPELSPAELNKLEPKPIIIDVRRKEEFNNELGHIEGARLITQGEELDQWLEIQNKETRIVFVCRSGRRSADATAEALLQAFTDVFNLEGGMLKWNELHLPVSKT